MKAIYINLDPYLQAVADWLNAGKPGTAPCFDPLPLAVTIPLGCDAGVAVPGTGTTPDEFPMNEATIDGQTVVFGVESALPERVTIAYQQTLGLSALVPSAQYAIVPWSAWKADNGDKVDIFIGESDASGISIRFPVLVRRETASGPVDLVDFTPPAALTAAAINTALGGSGAGEGSPLAGVLLNGMRFIKSGETESSSIIDTTPDPQSVTGGSDILAISSPGS